MARRSRRTSTDDGTPSPHPGGFAITVGGDPAEIPPVRVATRALAEENGFADRANDLVLALDEMMANAAEHGRPPITVSGWYDGRLVLTVADTGRGFDFPSILREHPPVMLGRRGRGLWIIRQVTDHAEVDVTAAGTTVRVELNHEPHIGA
jgi:anti-sigma regulatory factor (Ser/Thr protein kinase)